MEGMRAGSVFRRSQSILLPDPHQVGEHVAEAEMSPASWLHSGLKGCENLTPTTMNELSIPDEIIRSFRCAVGTHFRKTGTSIFNP